MTCQHCGGETLAFPVPEAARDHLPDDRPGGELCTTCLRVTPTDDPPSEYPDFQTISDAFPRDSEAGAVLACLLAVVDSVALYRSELSALARDAESRGVDVMLFLDRLDADEALQPYFDVDRRNRQLEQLLYE
ncbi:DUF6276 family protein [Halocalculus aciditolerans]|uniref:Small CPxCG-related zinc finger protein n=1 Tax=Halocalculus aciditolerans TaxID=1383812 RepID=A0A830FHY6_9EURY|nr:DUF6276 family protein [Halocalculus aciditolerans]GGL49054.1 hypothetical protein GCM10009039_04030 [Halocalculus aciditolerans]